ncbi:MULTISPECIES: YidC/Oxa1 family membrane protein insertase [Selenomonas]|uniref:YidC/Oxa1 family membrane protein insertase n=1 Tax=Selenomonas ruminantium TaxID=971 RepID=A0A1I0XM13_SELRU|nr:MULTISPECIES: YidC/Oxa1 family membrane protein insertase [Selenomonas]SDZ91040.1 YidC/Oxa1 family membrane protein insertase [Selenomonas ruminantium]SFB02031.1 YidC/Oxa1 family membrane protein insertase [Selenomonas ruminantium]
MEFFSTLFSPIESLLRFVLESLFAITSAAGFASYGWAIILLTIIVKMALYPLTVKQVKSMKAMQELSPKMKKIQEKYKDNPQVMQQKIGALYKDAGVNPLAGCLPLLIQMPILMGMYYSLYNFSYPTPESAYFLWMTSMSNPDPLYILPVLSALTTFLQQKMTTTDSNNPQMKMMMFIMPLFIGWISINFPSGLVLYWVTMNVVQIIQQWWMYRGDNAAPKKEAA